jgi:hypothetical protein
MSRASHGFRRSDLVNPHFVASVAFGILMVVLAAVGVPALPLAILAAGLALGRGLLAAPDRRPLRDTPAAQPPALSPALGADGELTRLDQILRAALIAVAGQPDGPLKEIARQQLLTLGGQFHAAASGAGVTGGPESWYAAHDVVLTSFGLREYRALVRVHTPESTQKRVARESLRAVFTAVRRGVLVERVLVLAAPLWPAGRLLPTADIFPWIEEQNDHGVRVVLVREDALAAEDAASVDTCVFDDWAVGRRDLDDAARTARVTLDFTPDRVREALCRLDRLSRLGISVRDLLDQAEESG